MIDFNKQLTQMHTGLSAKRLCADVGYWSVGASSEFTTDNNEQNPIKMASFYKESGNN